MDASDLERLALQHMPVGFLRAVLKAVFQAHRVSWQDCQAAFSPEEAENVRGYYRRGKLEQYLRDVAVRFPQMTATVKKADQSNWNHTEVRSGPVVLTENAVQAPCAPVEKAEFRLTLAKGNQPPLWGDSEGEDASARLYLLLLHSRSQWERADDRQKWGHLPGSAYIAFPARDLDFYVHEINLFDRFPDIVRAETPREWATEAQVRYFARARKSQAL